MTLRIEVTHTDGAARRGVVTTPRGSFQTPVFMPVGTRGAVRTIDTDDLDRLGPEIILGNTYHLMLRPGAGLIEGQGGLHRFMDWGGHVLTDSGGYQVFSLSPDVDDDGAMFKSTYDGSMHRLTPEGAVEVQSQLGSDIQMVLDVCPALPATQAELTAAVSTSAAWAARARTEFETRHAAGLEAGTAPAQFGIVQGGVDVAMRAQSAERTVPIGFEGIAIGGLSVGEERHAMLDTIAATIEHLPTDKPRYLMGVGDPVGIVESIALGIDMFDCVLPTRLARHGTALTDDGRLNIGGARFANDDQPLDPGFPGSPAARYSRAYLRHLSKVGETTAARILTLHNLAWLARLVERTRTAIEQGTLDALRAQVTVAWAPER